MKNSKVKRLIMDLGVTQEDISKKYDVDKGNLSKVISGQRRTQSVRRIVAEYLGLEYSEVWGLTDKDDSR